MSRAIFSGIAGLIWLSLLLRKWRSFARTRAPRETWKLLDDVQPPTREEIELYVPEACRNPGPEWIFTRGRVLTFSERRKTRVVGSARGFDVDHEFTNSRNTP